jgi:hypothetical protein
MNKKPILTKHLQNDFYLMDEDKAVEFDNLFDSLLMLLKLNHNLTPEIHNHEEWNVTLYARDKEGHSLFSLRLDATLVLRNEQWLASEFNIIIYSNIDISTIGMFTLNHNSSKYTFKSKYDQDVMLKVIRELVRCV